MQKCHYSLARTNNVLYYLQEIQEALEKVSEECLENKFYVKVSYVCMVHVFQAVWKLLVIVLIFLGIVVVGGEGGLRGHDSG